MKKKQQKTLQQTSSMVFLELLSQIYTVKTSRKGCFSGWFCVAKAQRPPKKTMEQPVQVRSSPKNLVLRSRQLPRCFMILRYFKDLFAKKKKQSAKALQEASPGFLVFNPLHRPAPAFSLRPRQSDSAFAYALEPPRMLNFGGLKQEVPWLRSDETDVFFGSRGPYNNYITMTISI